MVGATLMPSYQVSIQNNMNLQNDRNFGTSIHLNVAATVNSNVPIQNGDQSAQFNLNRKAAQNLGFEMQHSASRNQSLNQATWKQALTEQRPRESSIWSASEMKTHAGRMKSQSRFVKAPVMSAERVVEGETASVGASQTAQEPQVTQQDVRVSPKLFKVKKTSTTGKHARKSSQRLQPVRAAEPMKAAGDRKASATGAKESIEVQQKSTSRLQASRLKLPSIGAKAPASDQSVVSKASATASTAQTQAEDSKYVPKRTFNSMKHTRQSSYLSKVMLKKKGSLTSATAAPTSENASDSRPSDQ